MFVMKKIEDLTLGEIKSYCRSQESCHNCEFLMNVCVGLTDGTFMEGETPNWWDLRGTIKYNLKEQNNGR